MTARYICDVCGEEIEYGRGVVTITIENHRWGELPEIYHVHKFHLMLDMKFELSCEYRVHEAIMALISKRDE